VLPSPRKRARARARFAALSLAPLLSLTLLGCGGGNERESAVPRFNPALCPKIPPDVGTLPPDPNVEGVKANLALVSRIVASAGLVRLSLTFTNLAQHSTRLALPRQAFSLEGYSLVDHNCAPVPYQSTATPRVLAYGNTGPMPLGQGESATLDLSLDDMAPGLVLAPGMYAIRLALRIDPSSASVRSRTLWSPWALFLVKGKSES
jgi:hypothetical protein